MSLEVSDDHEEISLLLEGTIGVQTSGLKYEKAEELFQILDERFDSPVGVSCTELNEDLLLGIVGPGVLDLVRVNDVEGPVHLVVGLGIDPLV